MNLQDLPTVSLLPTAKCLPKSRLFTCRSPKTRKLAIQIPYLALSEDIKAGLKTSKPVLVCIGRLHPGEANGSHVLSGLMEFLCLSPEAAYLRKNITVLFVPMLNPDGVILGNSRTSAIGQDLNREFKTRNRSLYPQVCYLKDFCNRVLETSEIEMLLDFHGHSRKKNMFCFGPNYNITQPEYYRSRIMPKILSQLTPVFRYFGCDYTIPYEKSTTARAVMLQDFNIPYVYAIETSIGQYYDYTSHRVMPFTLQKWIQLGCETGKALRQYFESLEQFCDYLKLRQSAPEPVGNAKSLTPMKNDKQRTPLRVCRHPTSPDKSQRGNLKQIRLLKVLEEIKIGDEENRQLKKNLEEPDIQSDSQNEDDNLDRRKMVQFQGTIIKCIQTEKARQSKEHKKQEPTSLTARKQKIGSKNKREQRYEGRESNKYFSQFFRSMGPSIEIPNIKSSTREKSNVASHSLDSRKAIGRQKSHSFEERKNLTTRSPYDEVISRSPYFEQALPEEMVDKQRRNHFNLRMFNFSKIIEEAEDRKIVTSKRGRNRNYLEIREPAFRDGSKNFQTYPCKDGDHTEATKLPNRKNLQEQIVLEKQSKEMKKIKVGFPASFYRIKYQNNQKKKQQQRHMPDLKDDLSDLTVQPPGREDRNLFLSIRKVPKF